MDLYRSVEWSSANKPALLFAALQNSHHVITAWCDGLLVGLGNSISDGHLVVYYPHLVVKPELQEKGIGSEIMRRMSKRYSGFHQQMLTADGRSIAFYEKQGLTRAGSCVPMWIYDGSDHD